MRKGKLLIVRKSLYAYLFYGISISTTSKGGNLSWWEKQDNFGPGRTNLYLVVQIYK